MYWSSVLKLKKCSFFFIFIEVWGTMLIPVVQQSDSVVHAYIYSSTNIIFQEMFYGHLLLFIGMHNLQWLLVEKPHTSGNHSIYRKKKKTKNKLVPYCVYPMLLDNILQRRLSNQACWVAWLKKDAFMFQANRAFPVQLCSKLSLYQNSERCHQLENNALHRNSFFSCC